MRNISIIKINNDLDHTIEELFAELDYKPKKKRILIKPNLAGSYMVNSPFSTSTKIIEAIVKYFKRKGFKEIAIGEGAPDGNTAYVFKIGGYYNLQEKYNLKLIDLNKVEKEDFNGIKMPKLLKDFEYINVAKLKTHMQTSITLCIKNQKGLLPLWQKRGFHRKNFFKKNLHENISQLYNVIKPDLSIIDAVTGVEGNGPVMGDEVKDINLLIGGYNALDVDYAGTMIMGFNPNQVEHLVLCSKISNHKVKLDKETSRLIEKYKMKFKKPTKLLKVFHKIKWWYGKETCSGCIISISIFQTYIKKNLLKRPFKTFKLAIYALFLGLDLLTGNAKIPKRHGKLIACGDCCKHLADIRGIILINGCPPNPREIYEKI